MSEFKTTNNHLAELEEDLSNLKSATDEIAEAKNAAQKIVDACQETQQACAKLTETTEEVLGKAKVTLNDIKKSNESVNTKISKTLKSIEDVNFPAQLVALNATISGININVGTILKICNEIPAKVKLETDKLEKILVEKTGHVQDTIQETLIPKIDAIPAKVELEMDKLEKTLVGKTDPIQDSIIFNRRLLFGVVTLLIGIIVILLIK